MGRWVNELVEGGSGISTRGGNQQAAVDLSSEIKEQIMANGNKTITGLGVWMPQIFFDIIARLIPGGVIICLFSLAYVGPRGSYNIVKIWLDKSSADYPSITITIGARFILSYGLGVLVSGLQHICWLTKERFNKLVHRKEAEQTKQIWGMGRKAKSEI